LPPAHLDLQVHQVQLMLQELVLVLQLELLEKRLVLESPPVLQVLEA
jgi:hypothetical protein